MAHSNPPEAAPRKMGSGCKFLTKTHRLRAAWPRPMKSAAHENPHAASSSEAFVHGLLHGRFIAGGGVDEVVLDHAAAAEGAAVEGGVHQQVAA